jgi:hypothetical protein
MDSDGDVAEAVSSRDPLDATEMVAMRRKWRMRAGMEATVGVVRSFFLVTFWALDFWAVADILNNNFEGPRPFNGSAMGNFLPG